MKLRVGIAIFAFSVCLLPTGSVADGKQDNHGNHSMEKSGHNHHNDEGGKSKHKMPAWAKTLTKAQKKAVDEMHHKLDKDQAPFKQQEKDLQHALNELTVKDNADPAQINAKIDELMAAKNQILRLRYAHLVEMRAILTEEQRPSYDASVLERDKIK
ncbi:MAG: periplasmic heavy metal sensor [Gammaproteobacteria bacterium]|nr:periplasmic heavy metal sensor [Gammaproteobacteria bacterium]